MSRDGSVDLDFAGETRRFRLAYGELRELQEACDAGPLHIFNALRAGAWRIEHVRETIRLGLIGGGMPPAEALEKTRRYVEELPDWAGNALIAAFIISEAIFGTPDEQPGKPQARAKKTRTRSRATS